MISDDAARLVREITPFILEARPEDARQALCDLLGVLTVHVLTGTEWENSKEGLQESLVLICEGVTDSYGEFLNSIGNRRA